MSVDRIIVSNHSNLISIAYKMLGCIAQAEDVVHDTFVKWLTIDTTKIKDAKAFLTKCVTNNCINILVNKKKNISCEEVENIKTVQGSNQIDLEALLNEAWRVLHHKLEPLEKSIYVLRELFNLDYEVLQEISNKSASNCRKILSRAKSKLNAELPKINLPSVKAPTSFKKACSLGQLSELIRDFNAEITSN